MNKHTVTRIVSEALGGRFTIIGLEEIRRLLDTGALGNVFSNAVDKAIESKQAEQFQQEQEKIKWNCRR